LSSKTDNMRRFSTCAPIVLFCYKRGDSIVNTINSLKENELANESVLYIFSDGSKNKDDEPAVARIRKYLQTISGFKQVFIAESPVNLGLARSVVNGVSKVINEYGQAIVLEDDLLFAPNFLTFMNTALVEYEKNSLIFSISGFIFDMQHRLYYPYDVFFTRRHCSWGWATWKDRWNEIDWDVKDFDEFRRSKSQRRAFNKIGSDLTQMLNRQIAGRIDSWAIRCVYNQFKRQTYTVYPLKSKVVNTGFGKDATNTRIRFNRFKATLDVSNKQEFNLPGIVFENEVLIKSFKRRNSFMVRLYYYCLNKIFKLKDLRIDIALRN
jgi:Glycosyl transferase family 2